MKPEEVKLTLKDEARVMFNFLYHSFPWRYIIFIGGGGIIGPFVFKFVVSSSVVLSGASTVACGAMTGLAFALILFKIIPWTWNEILDIYRPKYQEHRAKIQKEAIDNVDDHLLK